MKRCSRCGIEKLTDQFYLRSTAADRLRSECKSCSKSEAHAWHLTNRARDSARSLAWRNANPERVAAWRAANPHKIRVINSRCHSKRREKDRANAKAWRAANPEKRRAGDRRRDTRLQRATPPWIDRKAIDAVYREAARITAETGIMHHVDHVVPIAGKGVCGLHVPWNLEIVPAMENLSKNNHFDQAEALAVRPTM